MPKVGYISASQTKTLLVNGKADHGFGVGAITYARELARQMVGVQDEEEYQGKDIVRGLENEWLACEVYAERNLVEVIESDFVAHPTIPHFGGTPDRLVGAFGGLDVKCPNNKNHHENIIKGAQLKDYKHQFQSYMSIFDREWWQLVSWNGNFPEPLDLAVFTMKRDGEYIKTLEDRVRKFWPIVEREVEILERKLQGVAA